MSSIPIRQGYLTIENGIVQIDVTLFGGIKRLYEQSKLTIAFLLFCLLALIAGAIVNATSLVREMLVFFIAFVVLLASFDFMAREFLDSIATASTIPCADIDHIEYTTESWFRPKLRIIVTDGDSSGVRKVRLSLRRHGGDQQLQNALQAFRDANVSVVPIKGETNEDY